MLAFEPGPPVRAEQFELPKEVAFGILGFACSTCVLLARRESDGDLLDLAIAVFLGWGLLVAVVLTPSFSLAVRNIGTYVTAAAVFAATRRISSFGQLSTQSAGLVLVVGLLSFVVLLEVYGIVEPFSLPGRTPGGTFGNRNLVARVICLALPALWCTLLLERSLPPRLATSLAIALGFMVIVLARSRAVYLTAGALSIALPAVFAARLSAATRRGFRSATLSWTVSMLLGVAGASMLPNRMGWSARDFRSSAARITEYDRGTGRGRLIQLTTTLRMIRGDPIVGVGTGNWTRHYAAFADARDPNVQLGAMTPAPRIPRSDLLPMIAEWGAVGSAFGLAVLLFAYRAVRITCGHASHDVRARGLTAASTVVTALVLGVFDAVLRVAPTAALLSVLLGQNITMGPALQPTETLTVRTRTRRAWTMIWCAYAIVSLTTATIAARELQAIRVIENFTSLGGLARAIQLAPDNVEARALLSLALVSRGRCDLAARYLPHAVDLEPNSDFLRSLESRCRQRAAAAP